MSSLIQITADGSHTLYDERTMQTYHSVHGAIQESNHIFIENALKIIGLKTVSVLEIGFGTGLNALLAMHFAHVNNIHVEYFSIEKYPLDEGLVSQLNYGSQLNCAHCKRKFEQIHSAPWNALEQIDANFSLYKNKSDASSFNFVNKAFDVVFFDAFSPDKQPELWTPEVFQDIYKQCNVGAVLTTYCAKGAVRRAMIQAGFKVERLPGPPGKREILRAIKMEEL